MNIFRRRGGVGMLMVVALVAMLLAVLFLPTQAQAQVTPTRFGSFLSGLTATNGVQAVASNAVPVYRGQALAVLPYFVATNATSADFALGFAVTHQQTPTNASDWSTALIWVTNSLASTTAVRGYHVLDPTELAGVPWVRLAKVYNAHTNAVTVTDVTWSRAN